MTFHNGSSESISLVIPGVMNPNLSTNSNSGVTLEIGQKVYFYPSGNRKKKEVLFSVESTWQNDLVLEIDQLIKQRTLELK